MEQRLIDANYAIELIKDMRDLARADVLRDAIKRIKAAPTVDAVPVEWIESYVRDARATGDFSDEMCAVAIEAMLNDYRAGGERKHE